MTDKDRREKREYQEAKEAIMFTLDFFEKRYGVALLRKVLKDADAELFRQECKDALIKFQANGTPKEVL